MTTEAIKAETSIALRMDPPLFTCSLLVYNWENPCPTRMQNPTEGKYNTLSATAKSKQKQDSIYRTVMKCIII